MVPVASQMAECCLLVQIVKGIDAVAREQLVQIMAFLGIGNNSPVFSMVPGPFKPAALMPSINEEDKIILNNVQKVVEFLTAGSSISRTSNKVLYSLLKYAMQNIISTCPRLEGFEVLNVIPAHFVFGFCIIIE